LLLFFPPQPCLLDSYTYFKAYVKYHLQSMLLALLSGIFLTQFCFLPFLSWACGV
jgi:hypothetical protein